jgi:hypothetical protein
MKVTRISRGFVELAGNGRQFRVYGEGLLPKCDGVEYVVYTGSLVEIGIAGGGPFGDEQPANVETKAGVIAFLKTWVAQQKKKWDFE